MAASICLDTGLEVHVNDATAQVVLDAISQGAKSVTLHDLDGYPWTVYPKHVSAVRKGREA